MNNELGYNVQEKTSGNDEWDSLSELSFEAKNAMREGMKRTLAEGKAAHPELPDEYFEFVEKVLASPESENKV